LDERWHGIFKNIEKTREIIEKEEVLKELLKEEARLAFEKKEILARKKSCLDKIIKLTPEVFDNNNEQSKAEMEKCEKEINQINERVKSIEEEIENMPERIREANLELLKCTMNSVYFKMRENQLRVKELEELIEKTRKQLAGYIDEKEVLWSMTTKFTHISMTFLAVKSFKNWITSILTKLERYMTKSPIQRRYGHEGCYACANERD